MKYHNPPAVYVSNLQLKTENLERALNFYRNILGFQIIEQTQTAAKLAADGNTVLISLLQPADIQPKQRKTTGLYHFALLLPTRSDLALFVTHLANNDIRFGAADHLVSEAIYFDDPDGNGIEVYADTDPDTWNWNQGQVNMDTIPLDFEDLLSSTNHTKEPWRLPESTIIGHIHLHVSELTKAANFYTKGLGFKKVAQISDSAVFMSTNNYHHHIACNVWNGVGAPQPKENSAGMDYFTLVYPDEVSLEKTLTNLKTQAVVINQSDDCFLVEDPAGNQIRLVTFE